MIKRGRRFAFFPILLLLASCGKSDPQEVSRFTVAMDISVTEDAIFSSEHEVSADSSLCDEETSLPSWGGGPNQKPEEFDFELSFSDDLVIVDYGKTKANVYHARYAKSPDAWIDEDWNLGGIELISEWCTGRPTCVGEDSEGIQREFLVLDKDHIFENLHSAHTICLRDLDGFADIAEHLDISTDSELLAWNYTLYNLPRDYYREEDWYELPDDLQDILYIRLSTQYVDNLPIYADTTSLYSNTFEWEGVIEPSRMPNYDVFMNRGGILVNPSRTCMLVYDRRKYTVQEAFLQEENIIPPRNCLSGIKDALSYDPCADNRPASDDTKEPLYHIWEKDVEVYCMELAYAVLDPCPLIEDDPSLAEHELSLVPVWEVYYTITDPMNDEMVSNGRVMINAVTGESLYSKRWGMDENEYLYPNVHAPG